MVSDVLPSRKCRGKTCQEQVAFVKSKSGKTLALNPDPDWKRGNVMMSDDGKVGVVLSANAASTMRKVGEPLWLSHHATCAAVAEFR